MKSNVVIMIVPMVLLLGMIEIGLRWHHSDMKNYDIEMWKYAREIKLKNPNTKIGFIHQKNAEAVLQSIQIRTNSFGLRGPELRTDPARRVLCLGSSQLLGWGVDEKYVFTTLLQRKFDSESLNTEILNGGIGNYNTVAYVELFLEYYKEINPTDIAIFYQLNDAEEIKIGNPGFLTRNSHIVTTISAAAQRIRWMTGESTILDYYSNLYSSENSGFQQMQQALGRLKEYSERNNIRVFFFTLPDSTNLVDYKFEYIHDKIKQLTLALEFQFMDLYPQLRGLSGQELWVMYPVDRHYNRRGHQKLADAIFPFLTSSTNGEENLQSKFKDN